MGSTAVRRDESFTWTDYCAWDDDERWELIDGEAFAMSPAPATRHQAILQELSVELGMHFRDQTCRVFPAPIDVRLSETDVVQPDLIVVCNPRQIQRTHIDGPPTLAVEILSPGSAFHDRARKLPLYARHGVREVWLITPFPHTVEVFSLTDGGWRLAAICGKDGPFASVAFPDLALDLARLFDFALEPDELAASVREPPPPYRAGPRSAGGTA